MDIFYMEYLTNCFAISLSLKWNFMNSRSVSANHSLEYCFASDGWSVKCITISFVSTSFRYFLPLLKIYDIIYLCFSNNINHLCTYLSTSGWYLTSMFNHRSQYPFALYPCMDICL